MVAMLKRVRRNAPKIQPIAGRFAIVASQYNARYVDGMVRAAKAELKQAGAAEIKVVRVPGAFEIPVVAGALARQSGNWDAVICLGVILQGQTSHAEHVGEAVTQALAQLAVATGVPMIHEVLVFTEESQARVRCLSKDFNRGAEAAQTALKMAQVMSELRAADDGCPF
ncbi:MAG: 6,7-dimethyl-8-ribityllumazine synthase [Pedosphaera sp. Tous-C6FEB]|nr:MAG: 6,7-dimethyl-8-ribityllumazine synthase [Pedosphaera sp. Tous-C6FEB]